MGYYINPEDCTKEEWLAANGEHLPDMKAVADMEPIAHIEAARDMYHEARKNDKLYVCLVNNGPFTAAGVAFDVRELSDFIGTNDDPRPKKWYLVKREKLIEVIPFLDNVL